jgi:hypothetical protein
LQPLDFRGSIDWHHDGTATLTADDVEALLELPEEILVESREAPGVLSPTTLHIPDPLSEDDDSIDADEHGLNGFCEQEDGAPYVNSPCQKRTALITIRPALGCLDTNIQG